MNKEALKLKIEQCFKNSERILVSSGELIPMLDIEFVTDKGEKSAIVVGLAIGDEKIKRDMFIKGLGLMMGTIQKIGKIKGVNCVVMMSEAWFSVMDSKGKDAYEKAMHAMPSKDPNRREMLIASGLTADGLCLMKTKEMFSVEVKGKRHFTLTDFKEGTEALQAESNVLNNFFDGYKKSTEDNEKNRLIEASAQLFSSMTLDELIERSVKVLTSQVGGLNSKFINYKK